MSHTPGPWRVSKYDVRAGAEGDGSLTYIAEIENADHWQGDHAKQGRPSGNQAKANAALIAAAPQLLAACKLGMERLQASDPPKGGATEWTIEQLQAAIAAAEKDSSP